VGIFASATTWLIRTFHDTTPDSTVDFDNNEKNRKLRESNMTRVCLSSY